MAQTGVIRGNIFDNETGEGVPFATVYLEGTTYNASTDIDGFFVMSGIEPGDYQLVVKYIGYKDINKPVTVKADRIVNEQLVLDNDGVQLQEVEVSGRREQARTEVQISAVTVSSADIKLLPSTGGEPDIAQYLTVLPGVVFTGDQGGQLYIRGGSPVQNKVLLDGMTIYNPFHSIGFFSVFETDIIQSVDVLSGGFGAEYGGRISAVIDVNTREGNKKRFSGVASGSPFQSKLLLEGPLKKWEGPGTGYVSMMLTGKYSYLDQTSPTLYSYAVEGDEGLPYSFRDLYGKISIVGGNGSKVNFFGFNFVDEANFEGVSEVNWDSYGGGANFTLIPTNSNFIVDGIASFSQYESTFIPLGQDARSSSINGFNVGLNFTYFGPDSELKYGIMVNGFSTDFQFRNVFGNTIVQDDNNTELSGYVSYRQKIGNLIIDPSFRVHYYASLANTSLEPRLGLKYNITDDVRFKFGAGLYSQNLISTVNERDIVNLFVGFLSGPDNNLIPPGETEPVNNRLQLARHVVAGLEIDLSDKTFLNIEPYVKDYNQLISLNRNKVNLNDPNFQVETGIAYGIDLTAEHTVGGLNVRGTYSLARVERDDGDQIYPTNFDRRHNTNLLASYSFGKDKSWETSFRWNYGSGFPFTQTAGFFTDFNFQDGLNTDILSGNPDLGILFAEERNGGRLPDYHRLDVSIKKRFDFGKYTKATFIASVTNAYDRDNIFYFDRVAQVRIDQLPILPSIAVRLEW